MEDARSAAAAAEARRIAELEAEVERLRKERADLEASRQKQVFLTAHTSPYTFFFFLSKHLGKKTHFFVHAHVDLNRRKKDEKKTVFFNLFLCNDNTNINLLL